MIYSYINIVGKDSGVGRFRAKGDLKKIISNKFKHNVSFEEAAETMISKIAIVSEDRNNRKHGERRFNGIALSPENRIIFIVFVTRENGLQKRIISARRANKKETLLLKKTYPSLNFNTKEQKI